MHKNNKVYKKNLTEKQLKRTMASNALKYI